MNSLRFTARLLFILLIGLSCVWADDNPAQLSLTDAVATALKANVSLKSAEEGYNTSLSNLKIAGYQTYLGLGATTNVGRDTGESTHTGQIYTSLDYENFLGTKASLEVSPYGLGDTNGSMAFSLRHPFLKGGGRLSEKAYLLQRMHSSVTIGDRELFQTRQSIVQRVIEAYYQAVQAREEVKVQESALKIAEEVADGTRKREKEGLVAGIEVSRADDNVAQTRDALNLKRQAERGSMDRLMLAIGKGIGQSPELTDSVPDVSVDVSLEILPIGKAIDTALMNRAELVVYNERISEQKRKLAISNDALRTEMNLVANFNSADTDNGLISGDIFDADSTNVGIEMRLPLDKRIGLEERDIAVREIGILNEERTYKIDQITEEVRSAYRSFESAQISLGIYSKNLQDAKDRLHIAQRMLEEGEGSNREVLEAQVSLSRTENSLLSAKTDLYLAGINLKHAMGEDLTTMRLK